MVFSPAMRMRLPKYASYRAMFSYVTASKGRYFSQAHSRQIDIDIYVSYTVTKERAYDLGPDGSVVMHPNQKARLFLSAAQHCAGGLPVVFRSGGPFLPCLFLTHCIGLHESVP